MYEVKSIFFTVESHLLHFSDQSMFQNLYKRKALSSLLISPIVMLR